MSAATTPVPVGEHRYIKPWWLFAAGFNLGYALNADSLLGAAFFLLLMVWMVWPLRYGGWVGTWGRSGAAGASSASTGVEAR